MVARVAHNHKVAGSSPASATKRNNNIKDQKMNEICKETQIVRQQIIRQQMVDFFAEFLPGPNITINRCKVISQLSPLEDIMKTTLSFSDVQYEPVMGGWYKSFHDGKIFKTSKEAKLYDALWEFIEEDDDTKENIIKMIVSLLKH